MDTLVSDIFKKADIDRYIRKLINRSNPGLWYFRNNNSCGVIFCMWCLSQFNGKVCDWRNSLHIIIQIYFFSPLSPGRRRSVLQWMKRCRSTEVPLLLLSCTRVRSSPPRPAVPCPPRTEPPSRASSSRETLWRPGCWTGEEPTGEHLFKEHSAVPEQPAGRDGTAGSCFSPAGRRRSCPLLARRKNII